MQAKKKPSAVDAAIEVLAKAKQPMSAKELIEAMEAKGLWVSPGGATPHATLASTMNREINGKGKASRFARPAPGRFALANGKPKANASKSASGKPKANANGKSKKATKGPRKAR